MGPNNIKVGDTIDGNEIIEIKGLVNGKPTWVSTFVCKKKDDLTENEIEEYYETIWPFRNKEADNG